MLGSPPAQFIGWLAIRMDHQSVLPLPPMYLFALNYMYPFMPGLPVYSTSDVELLAPAQVRRRGRGAGHWPYCAG